MRSIPAPNAAHPTFREGACARITQYSHVFVTQGKREAAERELSELRAEVKQLSGELRERDNLIAYKDQGGGWRTPDAAILMERQEEAERSAADAKRTLATMEAKAAAAQRSMQLQLSQADERNASLAEENGNLILELQSRPSVKQLRDAERRAEQVQAKLSRERAGASEAAMEEKRLAKEMESKLKRSEPLLTAAQIKRDKAIHHLRLGPVARLPKDVLVDLVQDICIQLELDDVGLLESGVAKLLRVMRAVPRMERFIAEVSEVVFVDGAAHVHEHVGRDPHQVPTVLKGWLGSLGTLASLHEFRKVRGNHPTPPQTASFGMRTCAGGSHESYTCVSSSNVAHLMHDRWWCTNCPSARVGRAAWRCGTARRRRNWPCR